MFRAGQLDHFVDFYRYVDNISESGMRSKVRTTICTLRCHLTKIDGAFKTDEKEQYDSQVIMLETWKDDRIKDTDNLCYCGQEFRIIFIDYGNMDRSMKIKAKKIVK